MLTNARRKCHKSDRKKDVKLTNVILRSSRVVLREVEGILGTCRQEILPLRLRSGLKAVFAQNDVECIHSIQNDNSDMFSTEGQFFDSRLYSAGPSQLRDESFWITFWV